MSAERHLLRRVIGAGLLAGLLLAAQALGLWHRVEHASWGSGGLPHVAAHHHPASSHGEHAHGFAEAASGFGAHADASHGALHAASAFGHEPNETERCRLFDQLALADVAGAAELALACLRPAAALWVVFTFDVARRGHVAYQARAPPAA